MYDWLMNDRSHTVPQAVNSSLMIATGFRPGLRAEPTVIVGRLSALTELEWELTSPTLNCNEGSWFLALLFRFCVVTSY